MSGQFQDNTYAGGTSQAVIELSARVENDLTLHPPTSEGVGERMDVMRNAAKDFAHIVIEQGYTPSREVSLALTKIEEALFYAIASVARNQ